MMTPVVGPPVNVKQERSCHLILQLECLAGVLGVVVVADPVHGEMPVSR